MYIVDFGGTPNSEIKMHLVSAREETDFSYKYVVY